MVNFNQKNKAIQGNNLYNPSDCFIFAGTGLILPLNIIKKFKEDLNSKL
jgi:hypothetical protein